jgi:hypothetical protein
MLVEEDHSYIYAFVLLIYILTGGITWGIIAYLYDDPYKLDRLLIIMMHTANIVVVTNVVENRLKQMFQPIYLLLIPLHVGIALAFRYSGSTITNISFNFNDRVGIVSLILLCLLFFGLCFHFSYHFIRYKKNKLGIVYFSLYLSTWVLFIGTTTVAYMEKHPLHLHHYALALMCSYGFTSKHPVFIIALTISLAIMNEGIATWGADLLYQEKPTTFYYSINDTAIEYTHINCVSPSPFKFVFWGHREDYTNVKCSFGGLKV